MANGGTIQFGIKYNVDQSSLNNIKKNLQEMQRMTTAAFSNVNKTGITNAGQELSKVKQTAQDVENALERAFNPNLNTYNLTQLNRELNKIGIDKIYNDFQKMGTAGQSAFRGIVTQIATTNQQLKQSHKLIDDFAKTMGNTIKWGITSSIMNTFTGSVERAYGYVKNLDTSLNDIRIVTNQSAEEMDKFAVKANNAAKALGSSTLDYTKASLIYYQQGLSEQEVEARANVTLKAANVTGQSGEAVSEQLTAIWNGYKVSAEEAEMYIDKVSAVAAATAADLEELSTGMSKVASAANAMGVDVDQLNAQLATIVSVTRQAPESVGTALKTIYARMSDLKLGETDEDGLGLGDVSGTMESMGIEVLDATGNLRDMGDVIEDVAAKWDTWTEAQKTAMAQVMAGKRQYNNLVALFDNWDMYTDALETSENATGTLAQQNEIYLESVEAHLQQLSTATEDLYDSLFNAESFKDLIDFGTNAINIFGDFIDSIGGGGTALTALGGIATRVFSKNIAEGLQTTISNLRLGNQELEKTQLQAKMMQDVIKVTTKPGQEDQVAADIVDKGQQISRYANLMSSEQQQEGAKYLEDYAKAANEKDVFDTKIQAAEEYLNKLQELEDVKLTSPFDEYTYFEALANAEDSIDSVNQVWENFAQTANSALRSGSTLPQIEELDNAIQEMQSTLGLTNQDLAKYSQAMAAYESALEFGTVEQQKKAYQELRKVVLNLTSDLQQENAAAQELVEQGGDALGNQAKQLENAAKVSEESLDSFINKLTETAHLQALTDLGGSILSITSAISGFSALEDIWSDDTLNGAEKFAQSLVNIGTNTTSLIVAAKAIGDLTGVTAALNAQITLHNAKQAQQVALQAKNVAFSHLDAIGKENVNKALNKLIATQAIDLTQITAENVADAIGNALQEKEIQLDATQTEALKALVLQKKQQLAVDTAQNAVDATGFKALKQNVTNGIKSVGNFVNSHGKLSGAIAAVAVIAAGTAIAINIVNKAYNDAVANSEKMAEASKNFTQAYNDANNALNQLQSDISAYKESQKAIDSLTVGTEEWKNAISDANKEVLNLMNNYSGLSQYVTNENGRLIISDEGFSAIEAQKQQAVNESYQAKLLADSKNLQSSSDLSIAQTVRDTEIWDDSLQVGITTAVTGAVGAALGGAKLGAAIGTAVGPGIGTAIGAAIGALGGVVVGGVSSIVAEELAEIQEDDVAAVTEAYQLFGESIFTDAASLKLALEEVGHSINDLQANALMQNSEALLSLSESVKANTDAQKIQKQQILDTEFQDNLTYQNSEFKDEITQFFVKQLDESSAEYKKAQEKTKEKGVAQQQEEYAALMGWSTTNIKEEDGAYVFSLADGTTQTIDKELLEATLTQNELLSMMEEQMSTVADNMASIAQIENNGINVGEGLLSFSGGRGGDLTGITDKELTALDDLIKNGSQEELTQIAKDLGYEELDHFLANYEIALQQRYNQELAAFSKLKSSLHNLYYESFETDFLEDLDIENKNKAINLLNDSFIRLGQDGFEFIGGILADNTDKADEFFDALDSADWSSTQGVIDLEQKLNQLGIEINYTSKGWSDFKESMKGTAVFDSATTALEGLRSKLAQIEELTGDIEIGSIISDEAYQQLLLLNPELEKFFLLTSQGYQFAGMGTGEGTLSDYLKSTVLTDDLQETLDNAEKATELALSFSKKQGRHTSFKDAAELYSTGAGEAYQQLGSKEFLKTFTDEQLQAVGVSRESINDLSEDEITNILSYIDNLIAQQKAGDFETEALTEVWVSEIETLEKLDKAFQKGGISAETYAKKRSILINKELKELNVSEEEFENYVKRIKDTNKELAEQPHLVDALALAYYKLNNGVKDINDNWEVWQNKISKGSEEEKAQVYQQQKKAVSNVLNYDLNELMGEDNANQFIESEEGQKAIYNIGVAVDEESKKKAIDDLRDLTIQRKAEIVISMGGPNGETLSDVAQEKINALADLLKRANSELKFGDGLPDYLKTHLQTMINDTEIAASTIIEMLATAGFVSAELEKINNLTFSEDVAGHEKKKGLFAKYGVDTTDELKKAMIQEVLDSDSIKLDYTFTGTDLDTTATGEDDIGGDDGKSKDTADLKEYNDELEVEIDRYHDVNVELQLIENSLKKLQAQEDKLVGQDFINNLAEQNKLLEDQIHWLEEKIKLKKKEASELQSEIKNFNPDAAFDEDGKLLNYFDILGSEMDSVTSAQKALEQATKDYNAVAHLDAEDAKRVSAEAALEAAEKGLSDAQELFNQIKELIEQYEQIVHQDIPDLESQKQDSQDEIIANQIEAFNYSIDIQLDLDNAQRQWNEFKHKVLEGGDRFSLFGDDILGDANLLLENLKTYPKSISDVTNHLNTITSEINTIAGGGNGSIYGDNVKAAIEDAQKYQETLMENLEAIEDAYLEIQQLYLDMLDAAQDAFDDHIASFEAINDILEHNISLVEKLRGEDAYEEMGRYYEAQEQNNNDKLRFLREQVEFWESQMGEEEYGSEAWQKAKENWIAATNELNSAVEESLDVIIAKYQNSISQIMSDLTDSLTGNNLGLDYLEEEWNLINENADAYLDKINSMFAIDELQDKYTDAINNTDNLEIQERLAKVMNEQVAALEEKGKLTEYDVERANLLYEIELKKIALEEAQQNKSKMRLRRDSQGNYSYQFTADEDAIAQTQNELDKLQNSLYNLDKEAYRNNLNEVYDIYAEFQDRLKELYADQTLSDEEREAQREMLVQQYGERINGLVTENEVIRTNLYDSTFQELARMYDTDIEHFQNMSQAEQDLLMQEMVPQWDTGIQTMIDKISADGGFGPTVSETIDQLKEKNQEYQEDLRAMADAAEIDLGRIAEGYDRSYESINQLIDQNSEVISMWNEQIDKLGEVKDTVEDLVADMTDLAAVAAAAMQNSNDAIKNAQKVKEGLEQIVSEDKQKEEQTNTSSNNVSNSADDSTDKPKDEPKEPKVGDTVTLESSTVWGSSSGAAPVKTPWAGKQVKIGKIQNGADYPIHVIAPDGSQSEQMDWIGWIKKSHLKGFDTGGYTGMWGSKEGKVAMLHEKELVLNKVDTENILAAVDIVRTISGVIDNLERSVSARMFDLNSFNIPQYAPPMQEAQTIEQQVHIDATFPNVQNSNEIEEAFNNLVNIASQHAFKTKR